MVGAVAVHVVPEVVAELCNQCYSQGIAMVMVIMNKLKQEQAK